MSIKGGEVAGRWGRLALIVGLALVLLAAPGLGRAAGGAQDSDDAAWAAVRAKLPANVPVYRPIWLPARYSEVWRPSAPLPYDGVTYRSDQGDLLAFTFGATNSCPDVTARETIVIHGVAAGLVSRDCSPPIAVGWSEAGETYMVRGERGSGSAVIGRDELLRVVQGLAPVAADGRALPSAAVSAAAPPSPALILSPAFGRCAEVNQVVGVRGGDFAPGDRLLLYVEEPSSRIAARGGAATVAGDGIFATALQLAGCGPQVPEGTRYRVYAQRDTGTGGASGPTLSETVFTVSSAPPRCFAQTGKCATGLFLAYWQAHGGLALNGYPLSDEFTQVLEDGKTYTVQYFERVRLEYHPENQPPYDILLGQFGRRVYAMTAGREGDPPVARRADATFFAETGHNVEGRFLAYWQRQGGLAQFGYPLTEPIQETIDGQSYTVQYFERARFELHPENPDPYDVLLGQFGREILQSAGR